MCFHSKHALSLQTCQSLFHIFLLLHPRSAHGWVERFRFISLFDKLLPAALRTTTMPIKTRCLRVFFRTPGFRAVNGVGRIYGGGYVPNYTAIYEICYWGPPFLYVPPGVQEATSSWLYVPHSCGLPWRDALESKACLQGAWILFHGVYPIPSLHRLRVPNSKLSPNERTCATDPNQRPKTE